MINANESNALQTLFAEMASDHLKKISGMIKSIAPANRTAYLRSSGPSDAMLLNIFKSAKEIEDYEVCASIKILLLERGIETSN